MSRIKRAGVYQGFRVSIVPRGSFYGYEIGNGAGLDIRSPEAFVTTGEAQAAARTGLAGHSCARRVRSQLSAGVSRGAPGSHTRRRARWSRVWNLRR